MTPVARSVASRAAVRSYSVISPESVAKLYNFEQMQKVVTAASPDVVLVDVREPSEFEAGHIPGAVNIPYKSSPGALDLRAEDFQDLFNFDKPAKDKELIFYCLGGVRSSAAEELANTFGYENRGNYLGSFEEWSRLGGDVVAPHPVEAEETKAKL
ncbi:hypothetical protein BABINDRAFT_160781 [Babjeviella inositovora NRRL Y-12698]|uniref:Rhodanese domain-containing protein n=1 Tax=Babjeviella inositovora NRRL Y-12698 TaxID=984486 RepID=A0A1E3QS93_9ASCO|nr:uncharacterized protein BABINDRAFT_160781 [Babjeviella inositovora NRRL Y-12698]ODQ80508.1 hypothetical protein BABINDRAFT_160781 [Babjeviella inositovora NRRL Y-12698]